MADDIEMSGKNLTRTGSLCSPDPHTQLFIAFQDRDIDTFRNILRDGTNGDYIEPDHWYGDPHHGTLLDLACRAPKNAEYVRALLQANADPNKVNPVRKKTPLHFICELGDNTLLEILLAMPKTNVNILDNTGSTALHYAAKLEDTACLVQLLNHPNINVNAGNRKGQTAVHVAAMQENKEAVMILIRAAGVDLDSVKTAAGKSARNFIMEKLPELKEKLPDARDGKIENGLVSASDELFNILRRHDVEAFTSAIRVHKNILDENDGCHTFLQYACEFGMTDIVDYLLRLGADPNTTHAANRQTPIMLACRKGYIDIIRLLVYEGATNYQPIDSEIVLHAVIKGSTEKKTFLGGYSNTEQDHNKCLQVLLTDVPRSKLNINCGDIKGNTPLHYAAKQGDRDVILLLLRKGAYVGHRNVLGEPALADIPPKMLETYLDECVTTNGKLTREDNYEIVFQYNFLAPPPLLQAEAHNTSQVTLQLESISVTTNNQHQAVSETDPLLYMSRRPELRPLLAHPVITSFLHLKWHRIRRFFYFNVTFYIIFWALLTTYILAIYGADNQRKGPMQTKDSNATETMKQDLNSTNIEQGEMLSHLPKITYSGHLWFAVTIFLIVLVVREVFQFVISPIKYVLNPENWLEILLIGVTIAILFCPGCVQIRHQISAVAILLSWAELVLLIGRHPALSTNIEMLKTVSWNFLKFLAWYSILIIAFALSFYTLFRDSHTEEDNLFLDPAMSVFKTVVMLTGEFDAGSIPFVEHPGTSHILFVLFVFLIAIVLFNLLNGLAVSDTQEIKADAELVGYVSRVKLVAYVETMAMGDPMPFRYLLTKSQSLCCCLPVHRLTQTRPMCCGCLSAFSRKINLFPQLFPDCEARVLPNQGNRIELSGAGHRRKRRELEEDQVECFDRCTAMHMEPGIVRAAKAVLMKKEEEQLECEAVDRDKLLLDYGRRLDSYKEALTSLAHTEAITTKQSWEVDSVDKAGSGQLLQEYGARLDQYQRTLDSVARSVLQTQTMLSQVYKIVTESSKHPLLSSSDDDNQ